MENIEIDIFLILSNIVCLTEFHKEHNHMLMAQNIAGAVSILKPRFHSSSVR